MVNFNGDKEIWEKLLAHINHDVVMVYYGDSAENPDNIAIECQDCFEVLIDIDNPANLEENDTDYQAYKEDKIAMGEKPLSYDEYLEANKSCAGTITELPTRFDFEGKLITCYYCKKYPCAKYDNTEHNCTRYEDNRF